MAVFTTHVYAGRDGRMSNMGTTYNGSYNGGGLYGSRTTTGRARARSRGGGGGDDCSAETAAPMVMAATLIITMVVFFGWCMEELRMNHVYRTPYNGTCDIADSYVDTWVRVWVRAWVREWRGAWGWS